jgi:hypothetical protein
LLRAAKTSRPKASLPDPEKFNGQSYKFDTWLSSIKAKLRVDGDAISDSTAQFYYVYLNLESHVQAIVLPQLSAAEDSSLYDYATILNQLVRVYDNLNKVLEAEDKLYALKQGTDSLPAFIAKFERVLYEARSQDWPDANKISAFRQGLSNQLKNRLAQQLNLPRTYAEFLRTVQQLVGRPSAPFYSDASGAKQSISQRPSGDSMDIGAINTINSITPQHTPPRARSTSLAERERRRSLGTCVRCGSREHWVRDCPLHAYKASTGRTVIIEAINDDDDGYNSSNGADSDIDSYDGSSKREQERQERLLDMEFERDHGWYN